MSEPLNSLAAALRDQDAPALVRALPGSEVALVVVESGGATVPAVLVDDDESRGIVAFTGQDTFSRWDKPERLVLAPVSELPDIAVRQRVDRVLLDPAGPHPASFSPAQLRDLLDGIVTKENGEQTLDDAFDVRLPADERAALAVRQAVADASPDHLEVFLVERLVEDRSLLTVCAFGPRLSVTALAHALSTDSRVGVLDVLALEEHQRDFLATRLPGARVDVGMSRR
jgi:hypothetical protein